MPRKQDISKLKPKSLKAILKDQTQHILVSLRLDSSFRKLNVRYLC